MDPPRTSNEAICVTRRGSDWEGRPECPSGPYAETFIENGNMVTILFYATYAVEVERHKLQLSTRKVFSNIEKAHQQCATCPLFSSDLLPLSHTKYSIELADLSMKWKSKDNKNVSHVHCSMFIHRMADENGREII